MASPWVELELAAGHLQFLFKVSNPSGGLLPTFFGAPVVTSISLTSVLIATEKRVQYLQLLVNRTIDFLKDHLCSILRISWSCCRIVLKFGIGLSNFGKAFRPLSMRLHQRIIGGIVFLQVVFDQLVLQFFEILRPSFWRLLYRARGMVTSCHVLLRLLFHLLMGRQRLRWVVTADSGPIWVLTRIAHHPFQESWRRMNSLNGGFILWAVIRLIHPGLVHCDIISRYQIIGIRLINVQTTLLDPQSQISFGGSKLIYF